MGGILKWVGGVIGGIIGTPFVWLDAIFGTTFFTGLIEPIMKFLGFEDEDIYEVNVIAVRVYDEDLYTKVMQDLHLEYVSKGYGSIDYAKNFVGTGENQFGRFYRTGKWDYLDYLPTGQITANSLDVVGIKNTLKDIENTDVFLVNTITRTPPDEVWAKYNLQQLYDYNIGTNVLKYENGWYQFIDTTYKSSNNTLDIIISTIKTIDAKTYHITTVTVTTIDFLTDNKNTLFVEEVLYTDDSTGNILYRTSKELSNTNTIVPKGSVKDSYVVDFISEVDIDIPKITKTINIEMHKNTIYYIVEYTRLDNGRFKYWLYDHSTNIYNIGNPNSKSTEFEMMPIVMLRNNKTDVANMDKQSKRYKQTYKMLKSVGVDIHELTKGYSDNPDINSVQDAFFILGVSPSDTNPIVSRYLFEMFDAIYDTTPFASINTPYSMSVREDPYNAVMVWNAGDVNTYKGTIYKGALAGDCKHTIGGFSTTIYTYNTLVVTKINEVNENEENPLVAVQKYIEREVVKDGVVQDTTKILIESFQTYQNIDGVFYDIGITRTLVDTESANAYGLIIQKQITDDTYKSIAIENFRAVSIIRSGVSRGKDLPLTSKDLLIPLALPAINRLTLMEKTALLGRSIHLIFYASSHTHLEWYQTKKFAKAMQLAMIVIMVVVTVVINVSTFGTGTTATLSAFAALMAVIKAVVIGLAIQLALKLISTYVDDPRLKAALSLVATAIGSYYAMSTDFGMNGITALQLTSSCVNATAMYMGDITTKDLGEFETGIKEFNQQYNERSTEQQNAIKGLGMGSKSFDMVDLTTNISMFSSTGVNKESPAFSLNPSQFYHLATNQAAYNYDLLYSGFYDNSTHSFVANKLQLGVQGA